MVDDVAATRAAVLDAWRMAAQQTDWMQPYTSVWQAAPPFDHWFVDGAINLSVNCLDRHLSDKADQVAIYWEGEPGDRRELTYADLHSDVVDLARALRARGVEAGDRVAFHLGWLPETVTAMLACARIGAVYMFVPTPLPVEALIERLSNFGPKVLFTQDGAWRRGAILPLKARIDDALSAVPGIELTIVVRRTGVDVPWYEGDRWYHELFTDSRPGAVRADEAPAELPAEHPLSIEALVNRRGKAVSVTHATARMLLSAAMVHRYGSCGDGTSWIAGDASWIASQASGIYGPLFWGQTTVMYEGALDTPNHQRAWEIIERYRVEALMLSPSAARMLREWSPRPPDLTQIGTLRRFATLGERADRSLLKWFADDVGRGRISVADGWGQVQLGGVMRFDSSIDPEHMPDPGFRIVDPAGAPVPKGETGEVILIAPWAGLVADVHGAAAEDVIETHWRTHEGAYATGDLARYDGSGAIEFLGRRDQVVSVAGHLVSLTEIREVLLEHPYTRQADVFEVRSTLSKPFVMAAVVVETEMVADLDDSRVAHDLLDGVREIIGGLARPRGVMFVDRFGDELTGTQRRTSLEVLASTARPAGEPSRITWSQVLAAAGLSTV